MSDDPIARRPKVITDLLAVDDTGTVANYIRELEAALRGVRDSPPPNRYCRVCGAAQILRDSAGRNEHRDEPDPPHVREDYQEVWLSGFRAGRDEQSDGGRDSPPPDEGIRCNLCDQPIQHEILCEDCTAEREGVRDGRREEPAKQLIEAQSWRKGDDDEETGWVASPPERSDE